MDQRLSIITLGVKDLAASRRFYEEVLGWKRNNHEEQIAFYNVGSLVLALYPDDLLADDMDAPRVDPSDRAYRGFTLALTMGTPEEVDELFARLRSHNVTILKEPHKAFWGGYSGYFADNDGHPWEVAHNPYWKVGPDGKPITPA
jgi:uncharacterized protein